jgi:predicted amidohydrolase
MSSTQFSLATAQSHISADVRENGRCIRALMHAARRAGADLIHFPEGALSGYVKRQISDWAQVDWAALDDELERTASLANELSLWVVLGANHNLALPHRPHNSLYVISATGHVHGRYDKRWCSNTEINDWYTPGTEPYVFDVKGFRFGCAICIEIQFLEVFMEYLKLGVDCMLFSSHSEDPMFGIQAQGYAASHSFWFSLSNPTAISGKLPSMLIGPSGMIVEQCEKGSAALTVNVLDVNAPEWTIALHKAKPWRAAAHEGGIYRARLAHNEHG